MVSGEATAVQCCHESSGSTQVLAHINHHEAWAILALSPIPVILPSATAPPEPAGTTLQATTASSARPENLGLARLWIASAGLAIQQVLSRSE